MFGTDANQLALWKMDLFKLGCTNTLLQIPEAVIENLLIFALSSITYMLPSSFCI